MKLAIFRSGCTREAAHEVAEATLPLLASLIDKSLLRKSQNTPTRYTMHELVRQYAYLRLTETEGADSVQHKHFQHMLTFASSHTGMLGVARHKEGVARFREEHDNLRSALQWASEHAYVHEGLQLAQACSRFWRLAGHSREGLYWFSQLLTLRTLIQDYHLLAQSLYQTGFLAWTLRERDKAMLYYNESLRLSQQYGYRRNEADVYIGMAWAAIDHEQERDYAEKALAIYRDLSVPSGIAYATTQLAKLASGSSDYELAIQLYQQCLSNFNREDNLVDIADVMRLLAFCYFQTRQYDEADRLYHEAMNIPQSVEDEQGIYLAQSDLGTLALVQGNLANAEAYYRASLSGAWKFEDRYLIAWGYDNLARVAWAKGQQERAVQLFAAASALFHAIRARLRLDEKAEREERIAQARQLMDETLFAQAWATGERMTSQQAYQLAISYAEELTGR